MQLNFKTVGQHFNFDLFVAPDTTILEIQSYIEFEYKIPYDKQTLIYESAVLNSRRTVEYYDINHGDNIFLVVESKGFQIFIKTLTGKTLTMLVKPNWTGKELSLQVQAREGIPICQQRLICQGKQVHWKLTLEQNGIRSNDTVHLLISVSGS